MKLLELLDAGPSAHTILSRFAKELEAKGFEAEVKSNSKPGIINRSKLCIVVKGYGLNDVIKLYRPLFGWEDKGVTFVDAKHERRFKTVQGMVDALKDKYKRLPKCLEFVPKELKESTVPSTRSRVLKMQQALIDKYDGEVKLIKTKTETSGGGHIDRVVFIAEPMPKGSQHYEHYKTTVVIIDDHGSNDDGFGTGEPMLAVQLFKTEEPFDKLVSLDWKFNKLSRRNSELLYDGEDVTTGRPECVEDAIAELAK